MTTIRTIRKALITAIVRSLMRGKTAFQALVTLWTRMAQLSANGTMPLDGVKGSAGLRSADDFIAEAEEKLLGWVNSEGMAKFSHDLKAQFRVGLAENPQCMLPSYNHQLPNGLERGKFLSVDMGGTMLRIAVVELAESADGKSEMRILEMISWKIEQAAKKLEGMAFFDWLAEKIVETVSRGLRKDHDPLKPLPLALAWSFPVDQTSLQGGRIQPMGKGYHASNGMVGKDLGSVIQDACKAKGLLVELLAIMNDSGAALLSQAYTHTSTRMGLILGTGCNISCYLPVNSIGRAKFGERPQSWYDVASHCIVNTELGLFGKGILPFTRWDLALKEAHPRPDFQPLEYFVSGAYLGEICRLALVEAIETTGIFSGVVPSSLRKAYGLDTETLSHFEADSTVRLDKARKIFTERHPSHIEPKVSDLMVVKKLASFLTLRSSALIATSIYTLWDLRRELEDELIASVPEKSPFVGHANVEKTLTRTVIAFNGAVIEKYPNYQKNCQRHIDELVRARGGPDAGSIELVPAWESSLQGAAVAAACVEN